MSFTSEHARGYSKKTRQLKNDKGTLIQTQEEGQAYPTQPRPFPGEGLRADGSTPKRDTSKDTDLDGVLVNKKADETTNQTGTGTKHAEGDIFVDDKGTYESKADRDNRTLNEDLASDRESEISKTY